MTRNQILFVNLHYTPDVAATGQNLSDLAEHLVAEGWEVSVLCGRGHYVRGRVTAPAREVRNGVYVRRFRTTVFGRRSHSLRVLSYAHFYVQAFLSVLFGDPKCPVVFLTTPPLVASIGLATRRLRGRRYGIWSMDLHPHAEAAAGMLRESGPVYRALYALNAHAYRSADFVVDLGSSMKQQINNLGVSPERQHTVNIWTRSESVQPLGRADNALRAELGFSSETVVEYSGNAGLAHRFDIVLEAIEDLRSDDDIRFLFIGGGPQRALIEQYAVEHRIVSFRYVDYYPRERLSESLGIGDIHLVTLSPDFAGVAVPAKFAGIMAAGRPVLFVGPSMSEVGEAIRAIGCGRVIDPSNDPEAVGTFVDTVRAWAAKPELRAEMGRRGRCAAVEEYDVEPCCRAFTEAINRHWT